MLEPRSPERIRADIERARNEVVQSIGDLRVEVARTVDWRQWYARSPGAFVVGAFLVGFMIGSRHGRR